jgi:hypothetical protein
VVLERFSINIMQGKTRCIWCNKITLWKKKIEFGLVLFCKNNSELPLVR